MVNDNLINTLKPYMGAKLFKKGEEITADLERSKTVYLVETGVVLVENINGNPDSVRKVGVMRSKGALIGLEFIYVEESQGVVVVTAVTDSNILSIGVNQLVSLLDKDLKMYKEEITKDMVKYLSNSYAEMRDLYESTMIRNASESVISAMETIGAVLGSTHSSGGIVVPVKCPVIASVAGLVGEVARRTLRKLSEEGKVARVAEGFLLFK